MPQKALEMTSHFVVRQLVQVYLAEGITGSKVFSIWRVGEVGQGPTVFEALPLLEGRRGRVSEEVHFVVLDTIKDQFFTILPISIIVTSIKLTPSPPPKATSDPEGLTATH